VWSLVLGYGIDDVGKREVGIERVDCAKRKSSTKIDRVYLRTIMVGKKVMEAVAELEETYPIYLIAREVYHTSAGS